MKRARNIRLRLFAVLIPAVITASAVTGGNDAGHTSFLRYKVEMKDRDLNILTVTGILQGVTSTRVRLALPPPGIGEKLEPIGFVAHSDDGTKLGVRRRENTWIIKNNRQDMRFSYDIVLTIEDRYSPEVRGMLSVLYRDRYRLMGRDLFLIPTDEISTGVVVDIPIYPHVRLQSTQPGTGRRFIVPDVNDLACALAVAGDFRYLCADLAGIDLTLAIAGPWSFQDEELLEVVRSVVSSEIEMFGSAPRQRYLFVCDENPVRGSKGFDFYGVHFGNSILLLLDRRMDRSQLYDTPLAIIAHEFFHNWNGEVIRPVSDAFMWFTEGATVYYSYVVLLRTNIISRGQYARKRDTIKNRYLENPYLETVAIGMAGNNDLSDKDMVNMLYDGGFLAAEALDLRIRDLSNGSAGLIDVLRGIYKQHPGGVEIDETFLIESILAFTGCDLKDFLADLVHTRGTSILAGECTSEQQVVLDACCPARRAGQGG